MSMKRLVLKSTLWLNLSGFFTSCCVMLSMRSEEHTSELQSLTNLVCRLLLEKKKNRILTNLRNQLMTVTAGPQYAGSSTRARLRRHSSIANRLDHTASYDQIAARVCTVVASS